MNQRTRQVTSESKETKYPMDQRNTNQGTRERVEDDKTELKNDPTNRRRKSRN